MAPITRTGMSAHERTAVAFDNPDFVDVVIHSYRHRYGLAPGDPSVEVIEQRLAARPPITVPTVVLHGSDNGVTPARSSDGQRSMFTGPYERHVIAGGGHNVPQEAPRDFAAAILSLI